MDRRSEQMQLSDILNPRAVKVLHRPSSKKKLLCQLAQIVEDVHAIPSETVLAALQEREVLGCTGVGEGIALPHARLAGLGAVHCVFLKLQGPVDFEAADRKPVDLVCALLAPEDAGVAHLKALALVSRTLRDSGLCAKLRANNDPAVLHALLTEAPASKAA
jgi:PTS system nitrogen regulatory IIA component